MNVSALITPAELQAQLGSPNLRVLDATYNQPGFELGIPGAVDFDIDDVADSSAPLAHTIPSPEVFAAKAGALGVSNDSAVVVYDRAGIYMAASRAWWMFRLFGHDNVKILNGGLPAWVAAGYALAPKNENIAPASFTPHFRAQLVKYKSDIAANIAEQHFTLLDARDALRYAGAAQEPRPGLEPGHVPAALNMPFAGLIDPATAQLKPRAELMRIFEKTDLQKPLACTCGSGVTACVVALGLYELGVRDAAVYDGSWAEWGADPALPKRTGSLP